MNKRMQQISREGVQGETRLGRQGNPLGNVQEISIRPYKTNDSDTYPDCSYFTQASVEKINIYFYVYYVLSLFGQSET